MDLHLIFTPHTMQVTPLTLPHSYICDLDESSFILGVGGIAIGRVGNGMAEMKLLSQVWRS